MQSIFYLLTNPKGFIIILFLLFTGHRLLAQYEVQPTNPPFSGDFYSVFFTDEHHGWVAGSSGKIYKYNGSTWNQDSTWTKRHIFSVSFTDSLNGWAVGDSGLILKYYNGIWYQEPSPFTFPLYKVMFSDPHHGWAQGQNNLLKYTIDSGWVEINIPPFGKIEGMFLLDSTHGYLSQQWSTFNMFNNQSWSNVNYNICSLWDNIGPMYFGKSLIDGWIVVNWLSPPFNSGTIIKHWYMSHWIIQSYIPTFAITAMTFSGSRGWLVGQSGSILCINNSIWKLQQSGTSNTLKDVCFINNNEGWIVGYNGLILHTTTGGFTGIDTLKQEALFKIYPNPTEGVVNLLIDSKKNENAFLQIWDESSRLIQSDIISLKPGRNDKSIDISILIKGIYQVNVITSTGTYHEKVIKY